MSANSFATAMSASQTTLARIGGASSARIDSPQGLAWEREMERAQLNGWFKPSAAEVPGSDPAAPDQLAPTSAPTSVGNGRPANRQLSTTATSVVGPAGQGSQHDFAPSRPGRTANALAQPMTLGPGALRNAKGLAMPTAVLVSGTESTASVVRTPPVAEAVRIAHPASTHTPPSQSSTSDAEALPEGSESAAAPERSSTATTSTQAPVRLHAESTPNGHAVWIAMRADDSALAAMLPQIVLDLQRGYLDKGQRLSQVVCNGRLVWRDGSVIELSSLESPAAALNDAVARSFDSIYPKEP